MINTFINYWSYLIENENKEISFETYMLSEDKKTYIQKHQSEEDFNKEILDKYWNDIRGRIKGKPEADIDKFWMNKSFKELADFVNNFDTRNQSQRKEDSDKQEAISNGAYYLGDMKNSNGIEYEVWIPTTHESAVILRNKYKGGNNIGTSWCISVAGNPKYWEKYTKRDRCNFVFLIKKNLVKSQSNYEINDKIAIQIFPNFNKRIWDMNDEKNTLNINDYKSIVDFALDKGLSEKIFPNKYKFIIIGGERIRITNKKNIDCSAYELTSLEGSPEKVEGFFDCSSNKLTTLENGPKEVNGMFNCGFNKLTSLKDAPRKVGGEFWCSYNNLTSLKGSPKKVGGNFSCFKNKLTSLEGAPQEVGEWFDCSDNQLTSLKGAPQKVSGDFYCSGNKLSSLEGAPVFIGGEFYYDYNPDLLYATVKAYKAYLKLPDAEKAPLTKNGHYFPTKEWEQKFL